MRYARLLQKLYAEPLMVTFAAWQSFDRALTQVIRGGAMETARPRAVEFSAAAEPQGPNQKAYRNARVLEMRATDTAIIYFSGVIDKHMTLFDLDCYGGVDLDDIEAALNRCLNDPAIKNVMLVFDTPGGSVVGVHEIAALVAKLAAKKNVFAFTDSLCASAGYYIASQASQIFCTYSASLGSIGVYCALLDETQWLENEGLKVNFIKAGKYKGMGAPFKKLEDDERALIQERTFRIYDMFVETVQTARPKVSIDTCQGQCFFGEENVKAGLADILVQSLDDALAAF